MRVENEWEISCMSEIVDVSSWHFFFFARFLKTAVTQKGGGGAIILTSNFDLLLNGRYREDIVRLVFSNGTLYEAYYCRAFLD